jgi:AbiJ-like protein
MDTDLKNKLWNLIWNVYLRIPANDTTLRYNTIPITFFEPLWQNHFKLSFDEHAVLGNAYSSYFNEFKKRYFHIVWFEIYDLLEFLAETYPNEKDRFKTECNSILESEISGYRFVNGCICSIINKEEIKEIETALQSPIDTVRAHIQASLDLFADKQNPDYRNSIKESISAVEAMCKLITKDPNITLGKALDKIKNEKIIILPQNLYEAFDKLYGYSSSSQGIRHGLSQGLVQEPNPQQDDARFFLIACSAFVNYLISKSIDAGISL